MPNNSNSVTCKLICTCDHPYVQSSFNTKDSCGYWLNKYYKPITSTFGPSGGWQCKTCALWHYFSVYHGRTKVGWGTFPAYEKDYTGKKSKWE